MGRTEGSGQGSIYKRGDKWRGQITVNGKRYSFTSSKKKDVIDWAAEMRKNPEVKINPTNITVKELSKIWLEKEKKPILTDQSYLQIKHQFNKHLYPYLGDTKVQQLTRETLETFYQNSFQGKYANATIDEFRKRFKELLRYAVKENIIASNPHEFVVIKKQRETKKIESYTEEEQKLMIKYLKSHHSTTDVIFYLLLTTGMRVGEVCALMPSDINIKSGSINIDKIVANQSRKVQYHPKTASSVRTIYMSSKTKEVIGHYLLERSSKNEEKQVFLNTRGNLYTAGDLRRWWIKTCKRIGIPYKGVHALRHTFATRALEQGIDIKTVSAILGHRSVVTTMNIYQDVYSAQKIKAAELLNDLF